MELSKCVSTENFLYALQYHSIGLSLKNNIFRINYNETLSLSRVNAYIRNTTRQTCQVRDNFIMLNKAKFHYIKSTLSLEHIMLKREAKKTKGKERSAIKTKV